MAVLLAATLRPSTAGATPTVAVFPIPGDQVASPQTQIVFRGLPIDQLGAITVTGSQSGRHTGRLLADSDGHGGSFLPAHAFNPGESVTVSTSLNIAAASGGSWRFTVADTGGRIRSRAVPRAPRHRGDVLRYRSAPDLHPAALHQIRRGRTAPGDVFLGPLNGPLQNGPMIFDQSGRLVFFHPLPRLESATDVRVQRDRGRPVLTWWQGNINAAGLGSGEGVIDDAHYRRIATVRAANGLHADLHEFQLTGRGTALITAYFPVFVDARALKGGTAHRITFDSVVQEIDIPTGLELFQWDSIDHVPLGDSYAPVPPDHGHPFDYFHVNSVQADRDGNLIVSARNTWAAYKVDRGTGRILWTLGGKHSSFRMGPGAQFAFQHDVRSRRADDSVVTLFDDGATPQVHFQSRGLTLHLDFHRHTATRAAELDHSPALLSNFEGNDELLPGGDQFVGWGQQPFFTEYDSRGRVVLDDRFVDDVNSYRAWRFPWRATPAAPPRVLATGGAHPAAFVSWNGATTVARWRVLGGRSPKTLRRLRTVAKTGFETRIPIRTVRYVEIQALDRKGHTLGSSHTVQAR